MSLILKGKGKDYVDGKLVIKNGKYHLYNATVVIDDNGVKEISDGVWLKIK